MKRLLLGAFLILTVLPAQAREGDDAEPTSPDTATAGGAAATSDTAASEGAVLDEITVTAQRREQSLQDVPVSVTAFSGDDLERGNVTKASDYLSLTPNVSFTEDGQVGSRGISIAIRGVNDLKTGENSVINSIGVYLDEFSVVSVANGTVNPQLQDLERIEVLRGPQGTYFGRNSVGGALNLTTRKPTGRRAASVTLGGDLYENAGGTVHLGGMFDVALSESLWLRGIGHVETSSGLVENIQPGATEDSGHDYVNLRLAARWMVSRDTTVDLTVMHTGEDQGTDETVPSGVWDIDTVDTFGLGLAPSLTAPNANLYRLIEVESAKMISSPAAPNKPASFAPSRSCRSIQPSFQLRISRAPHWW